MTKHPLQAAAIALVALALTACSPSDPGLPSLTDPSTAAAVDLVLATKELSDCLDDLEVPHQVSADHLGGLTQLSFGSYDSDKLVLATWRDGTPTAGTRLADSELSADDQTKLDEWYETSHDGPTLLINWVDKSADFTACLDQSGYDDQAAAAIDNPPPDPEAVQAQVTTNNRWAACARENGLPKLEDSAIPTGIEAGGSPHVTVPYDSSPELLRQALAACPAFNAEKQEQLDDWYVDHNAWDELPADLVAVDPFIIIDSSELRDLDLCGALTPAQQVMVDQVNQLTHVLFEGRDTQIIDWGDDC
ncbi:MAG: hypothetical protein LBV30_10000 [Propionibacteriaceae bacterium]|jgi:hypothetical protein|nr:hypothetical protein [Propionibacteriaceae bacterium]